MRYVLICLLVTGSLVSYAQEHFIKRIDVNSEYNNGNQVFHYKNRIYASFSIFCGNLECSSLVELDNQGNILWSIENSDLDVASETVLISNDTITITSNNEPINTHFRMAHFDLDGNKLGETMEIKHPIEEFTSSFCLTTQKRNGKFHIMGISKQDGNAYSLMYVVDAQGVLDTLIRIDSTEHRCTVYDSDIDEDGNIVTFLKKEEPFGIKTYRKIIKFDENLDSIWTYSTEATLSHLNAIRGTTDNGNVFFTIYTQDANTAKHSIKVIDNEKKGNIIYSPEKISTNQRSFTELNILSNGDIIGVGAFQDLRLDPPIKSAPWIVRFNQEGDIIWQRVFYELNPETNEARRGLIYDVVELPNGDLYGIGDLRYEFPTSFIFKIDADGCLNPDDCGLVQFITGTDDLTLQNNMTIYPNPASDYLKISISESTDQLQYMIIDEYGRNITSPCPFRNDEEIDISLMSSGLYHVLIIKEGKILGSKKIVVGSR